MTGDKGISQGLPLWFSELSDMQDLGYPVCATGRNPTVQIPRSEVEDVAVANVVVKGFGHGRGGGAVPSGCLRTCCGIL